VSDNLYLVQVCSQYRSYPDDPPRHPMIAVKRLFETEAAARTYRMEMFPPPWNPFANQAAMLEVRGLWKWRKTVLCLLYFPEKTSGPSEGTIKKIPLETLYGLIEQVGLPVPSPNLPLHPNRIGYNEGEIRIGDISPLYAWWDDHSPLMTEGQRAALWSLLDPFPYEIITIPYEKD